MLGTIGDVIGMSVGVPGLGRLVKGIWDLAINIFKRVRDRGKPSEEELERLREAEIRAREEYIKKLEEQFDLEFDVLRDQWQRNRITTDEFLDGIEELGDELIAAKYPWRTGSGGRLGGTDRFTPPVATASSASVVTNVFNIGDVYGIDDLGVKINDAWVSARDRGLIPA